MVIACEKCDSRFRLPDEKMSAGGVKVRCTKCAHVFVVGSPVVSTQVAQAEADPFSQLADSAPTSSDDKLDLADPLEMVRDALHEAVQHNPQFKVEHSDGDALELVARESRRHGAGFDMSRATRPPLKPPPGSASPLRKSAAPSPARPKAPVRLAASIVSPTELAPVPPPLPVSTLRRIALDVLGGAMVLGLVLLLTLRLVNGAPLEWRYLPNTLLKLQAPKPALESRLLSNGMFQTRAGRGVLIVQGEATNHTDASTRALVRVHVLDGQDELQVGQVYAGKTPSPEELFALRSSADWVALQAKLEQGAAVIPPNGRARFLVTFFEPPADVQSLRLDVEAVAAPGPTAAAAR
jgi:predicted Zn finger-like uncharacterized protein